MRILVSETPIPSDVTDEALQAQIKSILDGFALACHVEEREGSRVLVTIFPGPEMLDAANAAGKHPREMFAEDALAAVAAAGTDRLGALSRKYESGGNPAAFGNDTTGGHSYGLYQLAGKKGSVLSFIQFLETANPEFAQKLKDAGGNNGAVAGSPAFKAAWTELAADAEFNKLQHGYIKAAYYDVFVASIKAKLKLDIDARHMAVRNVSWSTAVQHGPNNRIFSLALQPILPSPPQSISDEAIISAVYDERSRVKVHFKGSTAKVQEEVRLRFVVERAKALEMLTT